MKNKIFQALFYVTLIMCSGYLQAAQNPVVLKQIVSAEQERLRMVQSLRKFDAQPTGFYLEAGKQLVLTVATTTASTDGASPEVVIGTLSQIGNTVATKQLTEGTNTIAASEHSGGMIYLRYVSERPNPQGKVTVTFTPSSQHIEALHYIHGTTTPTQLENMVPQLDSHAELIFISDYVIATVSTAAVKAQMKGNALEEYLNPNGKIKAWLADINKWMNGLHTVLEKEDEISGMDDLDPNPLHHRLKAGEVRYLFVETSAGASPNASHGRTAYPTGSISRYLTYEGSYTNPWMMAHEVGHMHQQGAYKISAAGESTVNIYPYHFMKFKDGASYNRTTAAQWTAVKNTFLSQPVAQRDYSMNTDQLQEMTGLNRDEVRFMPWEQLMIIFGADFYKRLHRVAREEKTDNISDEQDRRQYLIWKSSHITGYDMREFFNQWGIRVTDAAILTAMNAKFAEARTLGIIEDLPRPIADYIAVTGQNKPSWVPLAMKGITTSEPSGYQHFNRYGWEVVETLPTTGVKDNAAGGDDPDYIIDGIATTTFLFVKPGKSLEGSDGVTVFGPATNTQPYFVVDMKETQEFNYVMYRHRTSQNSPNIRASAISLHGKNNISDGYTQILPKTDIPTSTDVSDVAINLPATVNYRYLKVVFEGWASSGSTIQVAELNVGLYTDEIEQPEPEEPEGTMPYNRTGWEIVETLPATGAFDNTVGGNVPDYIIDESTITSFLFVKPGGSYKDHNNVTITGPVSPALSYFVLDMKETRKVNYVVYRHRTQSNTTVAIRSSKISIYGGNALGSYSSILLNQSIATNVNEITIELPTAVNYRYLKIVFEAYGTGNTVQVSDFNVGYDVSLDDDVTTVMNNTSTFVAGIYPNPVRRGETVTVNLPENNNVTVEVYDFTGRNVLSTNRSYFSTVALQPGMYIVTGKIIGSNEIKTKEKLIVK